MGRVTGWVVKEIRQRERSLEWLGDQYADRKKRSITVFGSDSIRSTWGEENDSARTHTSSIPYRVLSV